MPNTQETADKLARCFQTVFPGMELGNIPCMSQENSAAWDSVAQVTLLSLIGEEFGLDLDFELFAEAASFAAILKLIGESS